MNIHYRLTFIILIVLLYGCSTLYYGHTKDQWNALSEQEKSQIKSEYKDVMASQKNQGHDDKIKARDQQVIDRGINPGRYRY